MTMLNKQETLIERDEKGEILPIKSETDLEGNPEITVKPMMRGEIKTIFSQTVEEETTKDQDLDIIRNHLVEPKYTEEELPFVKKYMIEAMVRAIFNVSGLVETKKEVVETPLKPKEN